MPPYTLRRGPLKSRNLTKEKHENSLRESSDRVDSQAMMLATQKQPGRFNPQLQTHPMPSSVERAIPYSSVSAPVRKPDLPAREQKVAEDSQRPQADPTRPYKPSNGPQYSVRTLVSMLPRKELPNQYSNHANQPRENLVQTPPEPTFNHNSSDDLPSKPPPVPRKESHRVVIDNGPPPRTMSWEIDRSPHVESNSHQLRQEDHHDEFGGQLWSRQYDAVDVEDLNTFSRIAWDQMVRNHVLLRSLNAQDNQRLQILGAFEISHRILWDEIKRVRTSDFDARDKVEKANNAVAEAHEYWGKEIERLMRDQERVERQKLDEQATRITNQYGGQLHGQEQQIISLRQELSTKEAELRTYYDGELGRKETEFSQEKERLQGKYNKLEREKNQEIFEIEKKHGEDFELYKKQSDELLDEEEKKTAEATKKGEEEAARLKAEHAAEKLGLETAIAAMQTNHEHEIRQKDADHARKIEDLHRTYQNREKKLIAEHESSTRTLVDEVHAVNRVLLTRDDEVYKPAMLSEADLKQTTDEPVRAKFAEIVQIIDELSRLVWRTDQKVWTDDVLHSVGTKQTQRLLKKGILQDTIWTIIHRHILCSPFRMFGKEGRNLEEQWNERCGTDPEFDNGIYVWPPLSIENERWRYITLRECRKALIEPVPSQYDPRAKLKMGFKTAKDAFVAELKGTLDEMIEWSGTDASIVDRLVKRISNVWLEFGMYRCRYIVLFSGNAAKAGIEEKVRLAMMKGKDGGLQLNVVPGLRRHGNVKGVELSRSTVVGGFEGEFVRLGGESR